MATFTSTITEPPRDGTLTVYLDDDNMPWTYGAQTVYEVYVYTTTQGIDIVGEGYDCGPGGYKNKMKNRRAAKLPPSEIVHRRTPAQVEAFPTPVA
jgi:hypothetical protein